MRAQRSVLVAVVLSLLAAPVLTPSADAFLTRADDYRGATDGARHIATAGLATCVLTPSGAADCFGDFASDTESGEPEDHTGPYSQLAGSGDAGHVCGLTLEGAADCWGDNFLGQSQDQTGPFAQLAVGGTSSCGLTPAGEVDCWGLTDAPQPGPFTQITIAGSATCGLRPMICTFVDSFESG